MKREIESAASFMPRAPRPSNPSLILRASDHEQIDIPNIS